jgi:hypothetical protein
MATSIPRCWLNLAYTNWHRTTHRVTCALFLSSCEPPSTTTEEEKLVIPKRTGGCALKGSAGTSTAILTWSTMWEEKRRVEGKLLYRLLLSIPDGCWSVPTLFPTENYPSTDIPYKFRIPPHNKTKVDEPTNYQNNRIRKKCKTYPSTKQTYRTYLLSVLGTRTNK